MCLFIYLTSNVYIDGHEHVLMWKRLILPSQFATIDHDVIFSISKYHLSRTDHDALLYQLALYIFYEASDIYFFRLMTDQDHDGSHIKALAAAVEDSRHFPKPVGHELVRNG